MIDEILNARILKMWMHGKDTLEIAETMAHRFSSLSVAEAYVYMFLSRDKETNMKRIVL